jgi:hypothetical protein
MRELTAQPGLAAACKRLLVNRDPLALWKHYNRETPQVTIQRIIRGCPANSMLACRNGELLSVVSVAVLAADGPTGAATVIKRIDNAAMERAAKLLASRLRLTGFYGLDFMIDSESAAPYLIEMNPRCTQLGHLRFGAAPSVVDAFTAELRGERPSAAGDPLPLDTVAFFPQALNALNEDSRAACGSYLDVPWDEPQLIAELKKKDAWPERRWAARLYHALKPVEPTRCVEYGDLMQHAVPRSAPIRISAVVRTGVNPSV